MWLIQSLHYTLLGNIAHNTGANIVVSALTSVIQCSSAPSCCAVLRFARDCRLLWGLSLSLSLSFSPCVPYLTASHAFYLSTLPGAIFVHCVVFWIGALQQCLCDWSQLKWVSQRVSENTHGQLLRYKRRKGLNQNIDTLLWLIAQTAQRLVCMCMCSTVLFSLVPRGTVHLHISHVRCSTLRFHSPSLSDRKLAISPANKLLPN